MGFKRAREKLIECLDNDEYDVDASRRDFEAKNLLAAGEITREEVVKILKKCSGLDYKCEQHYTEPLDIHVFLVGSWYIKAYFIEDRAMIVSVHESGGAS